MAITRARISVTTDASGDATAYTGIFVNGRVLQVQYTPDGTAPMDTGADIVLTGRTTALPILTKANIGTSKISWAPRQPTHAVADGSALLYAGAGQAVADALVVADEELKLVVSSGGNAKPGVFDIWIG